MKNRKLKQAVKNAPRLVWYEPENYSHIWAFFPDKEKTVFARVEKTDDGCVVAWLMSSQKIDLTPSSYEAAKSIVEREYNHFIEEILGLR